jgi:16S rRNA (cytosine967-C5)-methyltransferase
LKKGSKDWRIRPIEDSFGITLRTISVQAIKHVEDGHFLDETIEYYFSANKLTEQQKSLIYEVLSGVVRWKGYFDWLISGYAQRKVKNDVKYLLWVGLYQVTFMKKADYHVVNETVEFAKRVHGTNVANFVNALLRRFIRELEALSHHRPMPESTPTQKAQNLSIIHSFPEWLVARWIKRFGDEGAEKLLTALNKPPEFGIRVNLGKIPRKEVISRLEGKGIGVREGRFLESALYVDKLGQVLGDDLFKKGFIHVQDEASQLAGFSVQPKKGDVILDACAGVGTKTGQLIEQDAGSEIIAMDRAIKRLKLAPDTVQLICGDAVESPFRDEVFDTILLDAPCSSLGIIRKHPEIKWRRDAKEIARFGRYQLSLLRSLWKTLKTGGHLIYSVCSFEPEETVSVIDRFRKEEAFILENPLPFLFNKEYFLSLPHETTLDGFFIAKLKKI